MRLKSLLLVIAFSSASFMAVLGGYLVHNYQMALQAQYQDQQAGKIIQITAGLTGLLGEYLLFYEERPKLQWLSYSNALQGLLNSLNVDDLESRQLLKKMLRNHSKLEIDFTALTTEVVIQHKDQDRSNKPSRLEKRLSSHLLVTAKILEDNARRLAKKSDIAYRAAQVRTSYSIVGMFCIIIVGIIGGYLIIYRQVLTPLTQLRQDMEALGQGERGQRAKIILQNEVGELGESFNTMAEQLEKAEEDLYQLNFELEDRVKVRTVELTQANALAKQEIEQREIIEAELKKAKAQAEDASEAKSRFLSQMSHEIRTPMNGVIGCVDLLTRSSLKPHQMELVETMHESSLALLTVIDDILDFSKIEAGQLDLEREPVSLERVVESACATMKQVALRKRLKINIFTDPRLPHLILSDSVRLRQIINNLLSNAIKFTRDQCGRGRIMVRVEPTGESQVRITVTDDGIGISAEGQAKLFKPFVQAESSTTRRYGGTGLGLSICKRLVDMLGGRIKVDSQMGHGSTFTVTLPIEPVTDYSPPVGPDLIGLHCLVVVQDMAQARDWCVYLEHAGASSEPIAEREVAQRRLAQLPPETTVVIMEETIEAARQWLDCLAHSSTPLLVSLVYGKEQQSYLQEAGIAVLNGDAMPRNALLQAIGIAAGSIQPQSTDTTAEHLSNMLTPLDREVAIKQKRLILVAEDNAINQKLICRQLTLLGYAADMVDNGRDALYAWRKGCYALLLTDLHMPVMDGYELTRAIRNEESATEYLPIIAITANALKEDANRCLAVGMDEYLSKPVLLDKLKASLRKWLPETDIDAPPALADITAQSAETSDKNPLDVAILANRIGDDPTLIEEFLKDYQQSIEEAAMQIRAALITNESEVVRDVAHRLKSSSRAIGALSFGECCEQIEQSANADDETLYKEFERVRHEVKIEIDKILKLPC